MNQFIERNTASNVISDAKSRELYDFIMERFDGLPYPTMSKEILFKGDPCRDTHLLSKRMLQIYLDNFWLCFHPHLPIRKLFFHTFNYFADTT